MKSSLTCVLPPCKKAKQKLPVLIPLTLITNLTPQAPGRLRDRPGRHLRSVHTLCDHHSGGGWGGGYIKYEDD